MKGFFPTLFLFMMAVSSLSAVGNLPYNKGSVLRVVHVYPIFLGSGWSSQDPEYAWVVQGLPAVLSDTGFYGELNQYGVNKFFPKTAVNSFQTSLTQANIGTDSINWASLGPILKSVIDANFSSLTPSENNLFVFLLPPGVHIPGARALHASRVLPGDDHRTNLALVNYGLHSKTNYDSLHGALHEVIEAATNPDGGRGFGWDDTSQNSGRSGEVADLCEDRPPAQFTLGSSTYSVPLYWSNSSLGTDGCYTPSPAPICSSNPASFAPSKDIAVNGQELSLITTVNGTQPGVLLQGPLPIKNGLPYLPITMSIGVDGPLSMEAGAILGRKTHLAQSVPVYNSYFYETEIPILPGTLVSSPDGAVGGNQDFVVLFTIYANGCAGSVTSFHVLVSPEMPPPKQFGASPGPASVDLKWNYAAPPSGESLYGYNVCGQPGLVPPASCTASGCVTVTSNTDITKLTEYQVNNLTPGQPYSFIICSVSTAGVISDPVSSWATPQTTGGTAP